MSSFRENLIQLMAVQNLALTPLEGLEGEELVEAQENNEGLNQLADAISQLHERLLNAAIAEKKPKTAAAAKKPKTIADDATAEETETEEQTQTPKKRATRKPKEPKPVVEGEEEEQPKKRATRKPKEPKPVVEGEEEPKKRAANAQAVFAKLVSQAYKGQMAGWDAINLTVSLAKVTEKCQLLLDTTEGKEFLVLKGTEMSLAALLQRAQQLLTAVDGGKVNLMKLSGLMWSSVGNQIPAQLQQQ